MKRSPFAAVALIALMAPALAEDMQATKVTPDTLTWKESAILPKGAMVATLVGDPSRAGSVVVQRVKLPPGYIVPPYTHPYDETVTIISGALRLGMGDKVDMAGTGFDKPGTVIANPAKSVHYVVNGADESIIQVQYVGLGGILFVNRPSKP